MECFCSFPSSGNNQNHLEELNEIQPTKPSAWHVTGRAPEWVLPPLPGVLLASPASQHPGTFSNTRIICQVPALLGVSGTLRDTLQAESGQHHPNRIYTRAEARAALLNPTYSLLYTHFPLPHPSHCPIHGPHLFLGTTTSASSLPSTPIIHRDCIIPYSRPFRSPQCRQKKPGLLSLAFKALWDLLSTCSFFFFFFFFFLFTFVSFSSPAYVVYPATG